MQSRLMQLGMRIHSVQHERGVSPLSSIKRLNPSTPLLRQRAGQAKIHQAGKPGLARSTPDWHKNADLGGYRSGCNIPWINYGYDFGVSNFDISKWDGVFNQVQKGGTYPGNTARIWVFADGRSSPTFENPYGGRNHVKGLPDGFIEQFVAVLDSAAKRGIKVVPTLWDFLAFSKNTYGEGPYPYGGQHVGLFKDEGAVNAFIDNALLPLVNTCKGHPGLLAWDIINEPEWAIAESNSDNDPTKKNKEGQPQPWFQHIDLWSMQRFVGRVAAAIHRNAPGTLVTLGSGSLKFNRDYPSDHQSCDWTFNYWGDQELKNATSDEQAYLDFYSPHWYPWMYEYCINLFLNVRNSDLKPMIIGETKSNTMPADLPFNFPLNLSAPNMARIAIQNKYDGIWFWSIDGHDGQGEFSDFQNDMFTSLPS